jgi:hypothetical protein
MPEDLDVACSLNSADLVRRQGELRTGLLSVASRVERLENGLRWHFTTSPNLLARIGTILDAERECCRFLRVAIIAEANLGGVTVEVTGPAGTTDVLAKWLAEAGPSTP